MKRFLDALTLSPNKKQKPEAKEVQNLQTLTDDLMHQIMSIDGKIFFDRLAALRAASRSLFGSIQRLSLVTLNKNFPNTARTNAKKFIEADLTSANENSPFIRLVKEYNWLQR